MHRSALIAIGGNALIETADEGDPVRQGARAARAGRVIASLIQGGLRVILTHGNGPQVGAALLRSEQSAGTVYEMPLDVCVASTQGEIGYQLQQSLQNELRHAAVSVPVFTVLTQAVVDAGDPAFGRPAKPIGPACSRSRAEMKWKHEPGRECRRVVPSPVPVDIVEMDAILALWREGAVVIAAGGGGIPVICRSGRLIGVDAVIDKDHTSALLASTAGIELLVFVTDDDGVYLDYGRPGQRLLDRVCAGELEHLLSLGQFPEGSMGPKIEAALRFLRRGGKEVIVTSIDQMSAAVRGAAGTHILPPAPREDRERSDLVLAGRGPSRRRREG